MPIRKLGREISDTDLDHLVDIPTMREMRPDEYAAYLRNGLFFIDHHDILRDTVIEHPIAATSQQVQILIDYLATVKARMQEAES